MGSTARFQNTTSVKSTYQKMSELLDLLSTPVYCMLRSRFVHIPTSFHIQKVRAYVYIIMFTHSHIYTRLVVNFLKEKWHFKERNPFLSWKFPLMLPHINFEMLYQCQSIKSFCESEFQAILKKHIFYFRPSQLS